MADLSNVVIFLSFCMDPPGRGGKAVFDLRGPSRLGLLFVEMTEVDAEDKAGGGGVTPNTILSGGIQRGHFSASSESSRTSTTSLKASMS